MPRLVDIVFDGPPGPVSGRFIEVEDANGRSIRFGEWIKRDNGWWALRISPDDFENVRSIDAKEGHAESARRRPST